MTTLEKTLIGLLEEGEYISSYTLSDYCKYYFIAPKKGYSDILGALEETLHRLLDYHFSREEIRMITGLVSESETDDEIESINVDLDYFLQLPILAIEDAIYSYDDIVWKPYILKSLDNLPTKAIVFAPSEDIAVLQMKKEYPKNDWYATEFEVSDGLVVL